MSKMFYLKVACVVCLFAWVDGAVIRSPCIQERTCFLPKCRCPNSGIPEHLSPNEIPQMVILTFEGTITESVYQNLKMLLLDKNNPNGHPMSGTLFVSSTNTVFRRVHDLHEAGLEIGLFSSGKHAENWASKILMRKELSILAGMPLHEIRGWREADPLSSEPKIKENQILSENGFEYGSSVSNEHTKGQPDYLDSFPYTGVSGMNTLCTTEPCRSVDHLWQMDITSNYKFSVLPDHNPCRKDIFLTAGLMNYLFKTFNQHYQNSRSPMVLNLPTICLTSPPLLATLDTFLRAVSKFRDSFVISVHQAIQWTQHPQKMNSIINFEPWQRSFSSTNRLMNSTDQSALALLNQKSTNNSDSEWINPKLRANYLKSLQTALLDHAVNSAAMKRRDYVLRLYQSKGSKSPPRMLIFCVIGGIVLLFVVLATLVFFVQRLSSTKMKLPQKVTHDAMYEFYGGSPV